MFGNLCMLENFVKNLLDIEERFEVVVPTAPALAQGLTHRHPIVVLVSHLITVV